MDPIEDIRQAARKMIRELNLLDNRQCISGFSFSECHLLTELQKHRRATASQLAEILILEKSTVSRLVTNLQARKLIQAEEDTDDRRVRWLTLTGEGAKGCQRINDFARHQVGEALEFVADNEKELLARSIDRYATALGYARAATDYDIRPVRPEDNASVAEIIRSVMTEHGAVGEGYSIQDPEVDAMHEAYSKPGSAFWVIEYQGDVLGCGGYGPLPGADNSVCELQKMYFLPALRGMGLGARLLGLCIDEAGNAGYKEMYLETLQSMNAARKLYGRYGFSALDGPMGNTGHSACNAWMSRSL